MSRIDDLGEILEGYKGRSKKPDYFPSEEDITKMHHILSVCLPDNERMVYISTIDDEFQSLSCPTNEEVSIESEEDMRGCLEQIRRGKRDFAGIVYYTSEMHPAEFITKRTLSQVHCVPYDVEKPDLVIIISATKDYIIFKGDQIYDNISGMET